MAWKEERNKIQFIVGHAQIILYSSGYPKKIDPLCAQYELGCFLASTVHAGGDLTGTKKTSVLVLVV